MIYRYFLIGFIAFWSLGITAKAIADQNTNAIFVTPIGGTPYQDWTIVNYLDLDPTGGIIDYYGRNYTYNGHNGIDFTLANFAKMDAGVDVYAAASGIVIATHDGEFDRNTAEYQQSPNANYITIDHNNGLHTDYWHLRKNSIRVNVGDRVTAGQKIAEVGSSGNSTDAHLHFDVFQSSNFVETYLNPTYWWKNPLPYSGNMPGSLDHGITDHEPNYPQLRERPKTVGVFDQSPGQICCLWVHLHGISQNDKLDFYFYKPNGSLYANWYWFVPQIRYGWWYCSIALPTSADLGNWRVDFKVNNTLWITESFKVISSFNECNFDQDATVNLSDFAILAWAWRTQTGNAKWNLICDVSMPKDGIIDTKDLAVFADNWLVIE
jgi:hypothetical protein